MQNMKDYGYGDQYGNIRGSLIEIHIADLHFGAFDPKKQYEFLMEQFYSVINQIPSIDIISIDGKEINVTKNIYLILNKPAGYISATEDKNQRTVLDLINKKYLHRELFPAGRLDKDTTGLMLITDDGKLAHDILSPSKHIEKTYVQTIREVFIVEMSGN